MMGFTPELTNVSTLRQARAVNHPFFNLSFDLLCVADSEGNFKELNPVWEQLFGFTVEELLAQSWLTFVHPQDRSATLAVLKKLATHPEIVSLENRYQCKDGSYKWLLWNITGVNDEIYAVGRDVSTQHSSEAIAAAHHPSQRMTKLAESSPEIAQETVTNQLNYLQSEISKSEQRLSLLIQQSPLAIIEWNLNFEVTQWNPAAEAIFGYSFPEAKNRHAAGLIIPATAKAHVDQVWAALLSQKGGTRSTNENITKNGQTIVCEWYNTPLIDADGNVIGVASLAQDVTERQRSEAALKKTQEELTLEVEKRTQELKQVIQFLQDEIQERQEAENALRESEVRFRSLVENSLVGIYVVRDEKLIYVNPNFAETFGYRPEELIEKKSLLDLIIPADRPRVLEKLRLRMQGDVTSDRYSVRGIKKDGTLIDVEAQGERTEFAGRRALIGTLVDISDRKRSEAALRQSEQRFRATFNQAAVGITHIAPDGRFLRVNQGFSQIVGYTESELYDRTFRDITAPEDMDADLEYWRALVAGEIQTYSIEKRYIHQQGTAVWCHLTVSIVHHEQPETPQVANDHALVPKRPLSRLERDRHLLEDEQPPWYIIGVVEDISDRKRAETALKAERQRLFQVLDGLPAFVYLLAPDASVRFANRQFREEFGDPNQLKINSADSHSHPALLHPGSFRINQTQMWERTDSRTGKTYQVYAYPFSDIDGSPLVLELGIDITSRVQAEAALRESEAQFRNLARREKLLNQLASQIRTSLDLDTILETAVIEIRNFLQIDQCLFIQTTGGNEHTEWEVIKEAKHSSCRTLVGQSLVAKDEIIAQLLETSVIRADTLQNLPHPVMQDFFRDIGHLAVLALPVQTRSGQLGIIHCGSAQTPRHWADSEVELLKAVCDQLAIAIAQAELYAQSLASARQAQQQAEQLQQALNELQKTQTQLIQSEKMSSLGQLVAGVAHEINNPINFIYGNITHATSYVNDLIEFLKLYQKYYPTANEEIQENAEEIELEFLMSDLPKILASMKVGADRIRQIVLSLRNFSRLDEAEMKSVNIHEGIENTLLILHNRLKPKSDRSAIEVFKQYGNLPNVECYPGQLNQVFMNILTNAIDALEHQNQPGIITIQTEIMDEEYSPESRNEASENSLISKSSLQPSSAVLIRIGDNGMGMSEQTKNRLFDPFFTTKPVGQGTGLGLSISYQIVVEKHKGRLTYNSELGKGTEFVIQIPIRQQRNLKGN